MLRRSVGHDQGVASNQGGDAGPTAFARSLAKVWTVVALLPGLLWLSVSVTHLIIADPGRWGYYLMLLLGGVAIVAAFHPVGRTPLSWPLPTSEADERVVLQERASWVAGLSRGGTVVVTDRRVIFEPNSVEAALKLRTRAWDREAIQAVELAPRGLNLVGGAVRRRVRLVMSDGSTELFVVHKPQEFRDRLATLIAPSS